MTHTKTALLLLVILGGLLLSSCYQRTTRSDTTTSGIAQITIDESFAPVIESEINVFESLHKDATLIPVYTSEQNMFRFLTNDSIRMVIGTRLLSEQEQSVIEGRKQRVRSQKIAIDGVALIVNKLNNDTLLTVNDIRKIMSGEIMNWKQINPHSPFDSLTVMFDTPNSSTVRYIQDSLCNGKSFGRHVKALSADSSLFDITHLNSHERVIEYVASHPNALGFVGVNWIANPVDSTNLSFIDNVHVVSVSSATTATPDNSYKPYPYQLALELAHRESPREFPTGGYPLIRNIYIIITDSPGGLPSGFFNFIAGDRGQRIILKSGLLPANRPVRLVQINGD